MAQITWRNVNAPDASDAIAGVAGASRSFDRAFNALSQAAEAPGQAADAFRKEQNELQQQNFENQLRVAGNERANQAAENATARLGLEAERLKLNQEKFSEEQLNNELTRTIRRDQAERDKVIQGREDVAYQEERVNKDQAEAADAALLKLVEGATSQADLPELVQRKGKELGLDQNEIQTMLAKAQKLDSDLFGPTSTQAAVVQEQQEVDANQLSIFDRESQARSQEAAVNLNVNPSLLELGQGDTDITALRNDINKRAGGGIAEDIISYFTQEIGRSPTVDELNWVVNQASEQNWTPFSDADIDLDARRLIGTGYKGYIENYKEAIGKGSAEQRKNVNAYLDYRDSENNLRNILRTEQRKRLSDLQTVQRNNRKAQFGGLSVNPAIAQSGNSEEVQKGLDLLRKRLQTLSK